MTTEINKDETNAPSVFRPLGKYAVIAVVMVSLIVTTAIMLDKQLNKAENEIASIENELNSLSNVQAHVSETSPINKQSDRPVANKLENNPVEIAAAQDTTTTADSVTASNEATETEVVKAEIIETGIVTTAASGSIDEVKAVTLKSRAEVNKVAQKTRMTDMFDRIKNRESKQLERLRTQQEEQVASLRQRLSTQQQQLSTQQQQIDTLIQRNENLFNVRAANVQRTQAQREKMLNRI